MAVSPFWTEDEKKRRLRLARQVPAPAQPPVVTREEAYRRGGLFGPGGVVPTGLRRLDEALIPASPTYGENTAIHDTLVGPAAARNIHYVEGDPKLELAPGAEQSTIDQDVAYRRNLETRSAGAARARNDPGRYGLTRIVKNPDGSYTNIAGYEKPGADVRYYNLYGNREGGDPSGSIAHQNATAPDLEHDDRAMWHATYGGRASLDYAQHGVAAREQFDQQRYMDSLTPAELGDLMVAQQEQQGANARAAALGKLTARGQDIQMRGQTLNANAAAATNQREALKMNIGVDQYERERAMKDPVGYAREQLSGMANLSKSEKVSALSDPNNPVGARARDAIRQALIVAGGLDPNFTPSMATKRGSLMRALTKNPYTANTGLLPGDGFNPASIGLSDEEFQAFLEADAAARKRARGR